MTPIEDPLQAFKQNLGARIDALEVAVGKLESGDNESLSTLRQIATSLREQGASLQIASVRDAASHAEVADTEAMPQSIRELITLLRAEARGGQHRETAILIIGGERDLYRALKDELEAPDRVILQAINAAESRQLLSEHDIVCIVLHLILPDLDGRTLLTRLREDSQSAAIPVLLLADTIDDSVKEDNLLNPSDGFIENPKGAGKIIEWVRTRLRRAPEANKSARRDSLTGLLNRAAFREAFEQTKQDCASVQETLAMACISVDSSRTVLSGLDPTAREEILQWLGLRFSNSLRATDVVARWGAYEFIVLLPGEDQAGATRAIEKVIETVRDEPFSAAGGESVKLVMAGGVALVSPEDSLDDAVSTCERFVYDAASRGGNQVLSSRSDAETTRSQRVFLLVHDPVTTNVLSQLFTKEGFEVTAFNAWDETTAQALSQQRHQLVVLDEELPPTDGFDVLELLREDAQHNRLLVAMLIASNAETSVTRALEAGANDYVTRPFSPFTFISRMRRLLSRGARAVAESGAYRILVVDDEIKMLVIVASSLQQTGTFEVCLARGTADGLARMESEAPNALLVDRAIGDIDGVPFLKALHDKHLLNSVSVVLGVAPDEIDGAEPPPVDVVGTVDKPYNPTALAGALKTMLNVPDSEADPKRRDQLNAEIQRVMALDKS
jgi:diguanylate cyclase (GGDEF)-like protein